MIGPLQLKLLCMMQTGQGVTAADLHRVLIRSAGEKAPSYSTVLSVLRNLSRRSPGVLLSTKVHNQLVFTLQITREELFKNELREFVRSIGWAGTPEEWIAAYRLPKG